MSDVCVCCVSCVCNKNIRRIKSFNFFFLRQESLISQSLPYDILSDTFKFTKYENRLISEFSHLLKYTATLDVMNI
jgi:hypothetical protein